MPILKTILILFLLFAFLVPNSTFAQTEIRKNLNVTALVPIDPSDFTNNTSQVTQGSNFPQNTEIEYKIDYKSLLNTSVNIKIEAQWSSGTTADQQNTVDIVSYVNGSATDGYGGAEPVIDTVNKKITWTITSFPASGNDSVTFKLKTNSNYQGSQIVSFDVKSRLTGSGFTTPYKSVKSTYKYSAPPSPTLTPTKSNPSPGPTSSPTPTPISIGPTISLIEIRTITNNSAAIFIQTSQPTSKIIRYGLSFNTLNQSASGPFASSNIISLSNLNPNTTYFFKAYSTNLSNNQIVSDIYSFTTAKESETSLIEPETFIATSNDTILTFIGGGAEKQRDKSIILPINTTFQFRFAISNASNAKTVQAIIRNKNVLGLNNLVKSVDASTDLVNMIEIEPGIFAGNLMSKSEPGIYEIYVRVVEKNGVITEQKVSVMKVSNKFTVKSKNSGKPIEGARIVLHIQNQQNKKYQLIPSSALAHGNPVFTDKTGFISTVLPPANYKADISELGYNDVSVEFTIGPGENENYPIVELKKENISILRIIRYYTRTFQDVFMANTQIYIATLSNSLRFFDLTAFVILTSLIALTLYAFSKKHHIPLSSIPSYFFYLWDKKDRNEKYIHGVIYDHKDKPITQANVYLTSEENEEIISYVKTNKYGEFYFKKDSLKQKKADKFMLLVMKKGYKNTPLMRYNEKAHVKLKINLEKDSGLEEIKNNLLHSLERIFGLLFELTLLFSFIFEILFLESFGLIKTVPYLVASIFNLALWTLHLRHKYYEV